LEKNDDHFSQLPIGEIDKYFLGAFAGGMEIKVGQLSITMGPMRVLEIA
jgi:hypothetical protein